MYYRIQGLGCRVQGFWFHVGGPNASVQECGSVRMGRVRSYNKHGLVIWICKQGRGSVQPSFSVL